MGLCVCRGAETEASVFCFGGAVICDVDFFLEFFGAIFTVVRFCERGSKRA
jgi:hypothetical protein